MQSGEGYIIPEGLKPNCQPPNFIATGDSGDSLKQIAQDNGVQVSELAALNPYINIDDPEINIDDLYLSDGDQICVPPRATNG